MFDDGGRQEHAGEDQGGVHRRQRVRPEALILKNCFSKKYLKLLRGAGTGWGRALPIYWGVKKCVQFCANHKDPHNKFLIGFFEKKWLFLI